MELMNYAESELARITHDEDGMQDLMDNNILAILEVFEEQGHSRFSASYAISVLERLFRLKPITPLTGEDDEWEDIGHGVLQNKRCSSVFKESDGTCYDIDGIIVSDNGGITWFYSSRFIKEVTFPYTVPIHPEKVYIEYTKDVPPGFISNDYEIITDQPERIKALHERKRKEFDEVGDVL